MIGRGVIVAAHLGDKAAARFQRPVDAGEHRSGSRIQCSAAFENTASNSPAKGRFWPSMTRASRPRARAAATMSGAASTATTGRPPLQRSFRSAPRRRSRDRGCARPLAGRAIRAPGAESRDEVRGLGVALGLPVLPGDLRPSHASAPARPCLGLAAERGQGRAGGDHLRVHRNSMTAARFAGGGLLEGGGEFLGAADRGAKRAIGVGERDEIRVS